jgi:hypothetical protein
VDSFFHSVKVNYRLVIRLIFGWDVSLLAFTFYVSRMERKQQMALEMRIRPAARFAIETTS